MITKTETETRTYMQLSVIRDVLHVVGYAVWNEISIVCFDSLFEMFPVSAEIKIEFSFFTKRQKRNLMSVYPGRIRCVIMN